MKVSPVGRHHAIRFNANPPSIPAQLQCTFDASPRRQGIAIASRVPFECPIIDFHSRTSVSSLPAIVADAKFRDPRDEIVANALLGRRRPQCLHLQRLGTLGRQERGQQGIARVWLPHRKTQATFGSTEQVQVDRFRRGPRMANVGWRNGDAPAMAGRQPMPCHVELHGHPKAVTGL